jgi:diaminopimelate decarboxylase
MFLLDKYPYLKSDNYGNLLIENIRYDEIVEKYQTPVYIYSIRRIKENCNKLKEILNESSYPIRLFYSYKTNPHPEICRIIHEENYGAEITSNLELQQALKNGLDPRKIIFDGPFKSKNDLHNSLEKRIGIINVDYFNEIEDINEICIKLDIEQEIGISLHPNLKSKIGIEINENSINKLKSILKKCKNVELTTLHCHMKTQNQKLESYTELLRNFYIISEKLEKEIGVKISNFDLGGGFPEAVLFENKIRKLSELLKKIKDDFKNNINLFFEPGRYVIGDAGLLLTKIVNVKNFNSTKWIIVDAGANIISPLSKAYNRFIIANRLRDNYSSPVNIGGALPASFDIITRNYCLPKIIKKGEILAILNVGAYSKSFSINFGKRDIQTILI